MKVSLVIVAVAISLGGIWILSNNEAPTIEKNNLAEIKSDSRSSEQPALKKQASTKKSEDTTKVSQPQEPIQEKTTRVYPDYVAEKDEKFYAEPIKKEWANRIEGVVGDFLADHFHDETDEGIRAKLLETMPEGLDEKLEREGIDLEKFTIKVDKLECRSETCRIELDLGVGDHPVEKMLSDYMAEQAIAFMTKNFFGEYRMSPNYFKNYPSVIYLDHFHLSRF